MKDDFSVLIQNRTEFEKGNPAGVFLSLPATKDELHKAMKALNITAQKPQDFFLNGYSTDEKRRIDIPLEWVREADLDKMNFLAARLEAMTPEQLEKLDAVLHSDFKPQDLNGLISQTFNTDFYSHVPGIFSYKELGDYFLNDSGRVQMPEEWKAGIDKEDFGFNAALHEDGKLTDYGYIARSGTDWKDLYTGKEIPEQYRIMGYPEAERSAPEMIEQEAAPALALDPQMIAAANPSRPIELKAQKPAEKMKEITDRLEQGIQELFESDRFTEYLQVMSKFHNYSFNNTLLIAMQKPDATLVAGYNSWKNLFGRQVAKGAKGIKVLAPSPFKVKKEMEKTDPKTGRPMTDKSGKPVKEEVEITVPAFKVVSVFDVSQTEGKELPTIGVDELTGDVEQYNDFFKAAELAAPVPVGFEKIESGAKGYYSQTDKRIAINEGMSELQNLKTLIHETAHAMLHDIDLKTPEGQQAQRPDRRTREVQAESVAYAVCQHYGLDTSDYSFAYIATWSSGRELSELKASLETIRSTASKMIKDIDQNFAELTKENEQEKTQTQEAAPVEEKQTGKEPQKEAPQPEQTDNTFSIYQLKDNVPVDYHFRPLDELQAKGLSIDPANYEKVYEAALSPGMDLERIFEKFNISRPEDFKGHSLSVSDVVVLHHSGTDTAHYVDRFGFSDVTKDFQKENPLKAAEQSTEQNENMVDGIINNTPAADRPETKENAAEQISLAQYAETLKQEETAKTTEDTTPPKEEKSPGTGTVYYTINEGAARRAKEINSYSDYIPGSATAEYRRMVDEAIELANRQKKSVDPMYHEKIDSLVDTYARKLAENMNSSFSIEARVPSILITGGSNFPTRKKEKQNAARDRNMEEWKEVQGLLDKIRSTGMGGISADDPQAVQKLEAKLERLQTSQDNMKAVNAYYRKHKTLDGCPNLSAESIAKLKEGMSQQWHVEDKPYPSWALSNNNAEIRRVKGRIAELTRKNETAYAGWEFDGGKVEVNREDNRLQIFFEEKPDEKTRETLKGNGFRWSPNAGTWQRQLNDNAIYAADRLSCIRPLSGKSPVQIQKEARTAASKQEQKPSIRAQLAKDKETVKAAPKKEVEKTKKQGLERS